MKTKEKKTKKELSVVQQLRQVRDKINDEIKDLSPKELMEYIKKQKTLRPTSVWQ
ncbi:hypothetical protein [Sphingobacterium hungaricum]|uniref:hypothetical protein n=1 Tax=Sphingobacterium hungaricum TaxID=2082723 RepID=UPI0018C97399|nr:hypothetical protein [Sphingobacterium hungaricum]